MMTSTRVSSPSSTSILLVVETGVVETGETDLHEVVRVLGMNNSDEGFNCESFNLRNS